MNSRCRSFDLLLFYRFDSICCCCDRSLSHIILVTIAEIGKAGKTIDMCTSGSWTGSLAYIWSPEFPSWTDVPHCACNIKLHRPVELQIKVHFYLSLAIFPFVRGEVLPATSSPPHLLFFSILLCLLSSSILPPLLPSSHIS